MTKRDFPGWLKNEMDKRHWTTTKMAAESYIAEASIRKYIKGKGFPSMEVLFDILDALGYEMEFVEKEGER